MSLIEFQVRFHSAACDDGMVTGIGCCGMACYLSVSLTIILPMPLTAVIRNCLYSIWLFVMPRRQCRRRIWLIVGVIVIFFVWKLVNLAYAQGLDGWRWCCRLEGSQSVQVRFCHGNVGERDRVADDGLKNKTAFAPDKELGGAQGKTCRLINVIREVD